MSGERLDEAHPLGNGDELRGRHPTALRVLPPGERLEPCHLAGGHGDLRLVKEDDLPALERPSELGAQYEPPGIVRIILGAIDGVGSAGPLRRVHRHIGPLQQCFGRRAMVWRGRDSDAGRHLEGMLLAEERGLQRPQEAVSDPGGVRDVGPWQQNGELIATQPGNHGANVQSLAEPRSDLAQQDVAHLVTEAVVDLFEVVDVQQKER